MKTIFLLFALILVNKLTYAQGIPWRNDCPGITGCEHVGMTAFNHPDTVGNKYLREIPLGTIIGVIELRAGSYIASGDYPRYSERYDRYYIIDTDGVSPVSFLRVVREITPR